jgi:hypothetical protein
VQGSVEIEMICPERDLSLKKDGSRKGSRWKLKLSF